MWWGENWIVEGFFLLFQVANNRSMFPKEYFCPIPTVITGAPTNFELYIS